MSSESDAVAIGMCGLATYKKGWIAIRNGNLNINALMSIAVTGALLLGQWPEAAMVMLTLCDADTPIWLDRRLAASDALLQWIAFHCGAPVTAEPMDAHFAFVSDATHMSPLGTFCCGTQDYPDRSTTIVVQIEDLSGGGSLRIAGPGIDGSREWSPHPLPRGFAIEWASNHARFPRGVDLVMVAPGKLAAMPRSTRILAAGSPV